MSKSNRESEKWQRVLSAAKASRREAEQPPTSGGDMPAPPREFSSNLFGRLRAFHRSLAAWQRWSLVAGLVSILLFIASIIYLKSTSSNQSPPLIETPGLELPQPSPHSKN